ncbi:MAG TPA: MFS transporter [Xanthomonadales bacterium]|nr:MFS transporter [Xanthomonadales bacterium]
MNSPGKAETAGEWSGSNPPDTPDLVRQFKPVYAWFVVALLMVAYTFSFLDRQILALLVGDIKAHLQISDTQIGLLQGLAFTLFYTTLGIPIARLADNSNRRNLIVAGITVWSVMTVSCGYARNFLTLFLARMGVGVGEAALSPAAYSIITDYFPRHHLSKALSVYTMGVYIGGGIAFTVGGHLVAKLSEMDFSNMPVLASLQGWQLAFIAAGLPGLLVAAAIFRFVREPARTTSARQTLSGEHVPLRKAISYLKENRKAYMPIYLGYSLQAIAILGTFAWLPTQLIREFGWSVAQAGQSVGVSIFIFGCMGVLTGGAMCDRMLKSGRFDAPLILGVMGSLGMCLVFVGAYYFDVSVETKAFIYGTAFFFMGLVAGPAPASIALIAPHRLRAQLSAVFLFSINFLGMTLGPLLPAILSDNFPDVVTSIGMALMIIVVASTLTSIAVFLMYRRHYRQVCSQVQDGI